MIDLQPFWKVRLIGFIILSVIIGLIVLVVLFLGGL